MSLEYDEMSTPGISKYARLLFAVTVALLFYSLDIVAQQDLKVSEIEVVKNFDARLIETQKIPITPRLPDLDTTARTYEYEITIANPKITYLPPQIRPLAVRPEEQPNAYRGFLRAGYGVPNAFAGEASYLVVDNDLLQVMLSGHHQSANDKDNYLQKFSDSGGTLTATYLVSSALSVSGDIDYNQNKVYFYGLKPEDTTPYVDESRKFKTFTAHVAAGNPERLSGDINYNVSFDIYNHQDDLSANENGLKLHATGEKWFGSNVLSLEMIAALTKLKDSEQERDLDNFSLRPSFALHKHTYGLKGGLTLAVHDSELFIYPLLHASVQVAGNRVIVFAEIDGGLEKNDFRTLSAYNPFLHQRIDEIRNTEHRDYILGVKGRINKFEYQGSAGFSMVKGLALFTHDEFDYRKFQPLYDDGNLIRIEGTVKAELIPRLQVGLRCAKIFYDLDVQDEAWHLPGLDASIFSTYISGDQKLQFRGALQIENGVPYLNAFDEADKLKGVFDLSLGADYYFTKNIGGFVQANNIFGNKHEQWDRYTVYGINGVAGILVRI